VKLIKDMREWFDTSDWWFFWMLFGLISLFFVGAALVLLSGDLGIMFWVLLSGGMLLGSALVRFCQLIVDSSSGRR
jgi:FtsH-binding integral membrane protein